MQGRSSPTSGTVSPACLNLAGADSGGSPNAPDGRITAQDRVQARGCGAAQEDQESVTQGRGRGTTADLFPRRECSVDPGMMQRCWIHAVESTVRPDEDALGRVPLCVQPLSCNKGT